jgi:hypothetical protein
VIGDQLNVQDQAGVALTQPSTVHGTLIQAVVVVVAITTLVKDPAAPAAAAKAADNNVVAQTLVQIQVVVVVVRTIQEYLEQAAQELLL